MAIFVALYCLTLVVVMVSAAEREWPTFFGCGLLMLIASAMVGKLMKDRKKWKRY